jgi:hypothetical protein
MFDGHRLVLQVGGQERGKGACSIVPSMSGRGAPEYVTIG